MIARAFFGPSTVPLHVGCSREEPPFIDEPHERVALRRDQSESSFVRGAFQFERGPSTQRGVGLDAARPRNTRPRARSGPASRRPARPSGRGGCVVTILIGPILWGGRPALLLFLRRSSPSRREATVIPFAGSASPRRVVPSQKVQQTSRRRPRPHHPNAARRARRATSATTITQHPPFLRPTAGRASGPPTPSGRAASPSRRRVF